MFYECKIVMYTDCVVTVARSYWSVHESLKFPRTSETYFQKGEECSIPILHLYNHPYNLCTGQCLYTHNSSTINYTWSYAHTQNLYVPKKCLSLVKLTTLRSEATITFLQSVLDKSIVCHIQKDVFALYRKESLSRRLLVERATAGRQRGESTATKLLQPIQHSTAETYTSGSLSTPRERRHFLCDTGLSSGYMVYDRGDHLHPNSHC